MAKQRTKAPKRPSGARPAPRPPGARHRPKRRSGGTRRRRWNWWLLVVIAAVVAIGIGLLVASRGSKSPSAPSSSSELVLAPAGQPSGRPIDGVECNAGEQLAFHIHAHLALFVDGAERAVPAFVGFDDDQCLYWLHSHDSSGIIHMEAPRNTSFTLGQWFDIWGQPLSSTQVGPARGTVTSFVNGQRFSGDPRSIPLTAHAVIQLNVGKDVAPRSYQFPEGY